MHKEVAEPQVLRAPVKAKSIIYFDLEDEETRDKDAVTDFMNKYTKLWKNLFTKYQNVGFSHKN